MPKGDSRQRFVELAEKRVTKAIKAIRLVGNLSNRSNYTYSSEDAKKIVKAIDVELRKLKRQFDGQATSGDIDFKLG